MTSDLPVLVAIFTEGPWLYGAIAVLLVVESAWPDRGNQGDSVSRWAIHVALFAVTRGVAWLIVAALAWAGTWLHGAAPGPWSGWLHLVMVLLALDATTYAAHRLSHRMPLLWRWHSLHHGDRILDIGTTWRHHPLEAFVVGAVLGSVAVVIGARPAEVATYAGLALSTQILAHANLRLPRALGWLSAVWVTPSLHHLHHAPDVRDTDSNYGEVLSIWDRLSGTYNAPRGGVEEFGLRPAQPASP